MTFHSIRSACLIAFALAACSDQTDQVSLMGATQRASVMDPSLAPLLTSATNSPPGSSIRVRPGSYIVIFSDSIPQGAAAVALTKRFEQEHGFSARHTFRRVKGFSANLPIQAVNALRKNPRVKFIEEERLGRSSK